MLNSKEVVSKPIKNIESLLGSMPKKCSCHICEITKNVAKKELGEKQYKILCNSFGISN